MPGTPTWTLRSNATDVTRPRVVVVGAGFSGLWAVRALSGQGLSVTLVDQENYHTFFPLLYQVAAAELGPTSIGYPVRSLLRPLEDVQFKLATAIGVDAPGGGVLLEGGGRLPYDAVLLATGSVAHFFGVPGAEEHAFPLRRMDEALELRHRILTRFEAGAAMDPGPERDRALSFVIVGGGATGVEFAGALGELVFGPLLADYPEIGPHQVRIVLIEGAPSVLSTLHPDLSRYAAERLESRGVQLRLGTAVASIDARGVTLSDDRRIDADTVVWTAGVQGDPLFQGTELAVGKGGRLVVEPTLQARGWENVFVAGDLALVTHEGRPIPQVAPAAIQLGEAAAANIVRLFQKKSLLPFRYEDPGMMAVIGRYAAVADIGGYRGGGFFPWILWALIHIAKLIGFRSRLLVLVNWAWNYFSFRRSVRLILPERSP